MHRIKIGSKVTAYLDLIQIQFEKFGMGHLTAETRRTREGNREKKIADVSR